MKFFLTYLKHKLWIIAIFCLFAAILCVSFWLYRLPVEAAAYPLILCCTCGALFLAYDFVRARRKHEALCRMLGFTAGMIGELPDPSDPAEADYREIVRMLQEENARVAANNIAAFDETVDYYTAWVHQIKTPIASMKLTLQNEDTALSRKLACDLLRIEQYVGMVLTFLRLDSDTSDYVFREVPLDTVVCDAVRKFAPEFIDRKLRLDYRPITETVVTDEKWLSFVIEQIISNSLKYTREGGISITLVKPLTLCICDTGIGISPEDLPRIFQKGFTGRNGRADKNASGIGLYLCKRVCDNLGAKITADSSAGKGTVVFIDLSLHEAVIE